MIESPQARPKKEMKPILPIKDFEDVLLQLKPDPSCRQCYGRGYMSFTHNLQGGTTMNLCGCAMFGETELLKVLRSIGLTITAVNALGAAVSEALSRIEKNQADAREDASLALERIEARLNRPNIFRRVVNSLMLQVDHSQQRKDEVC